MVAFLPADVAKGPVVPGVLGDVADLVDRVVMQQHLHGGDVKHYNASQYAFFNVKVFLLYTTFYTHCTLC